MISLYTSHFAPARVVETQTIRPIQVGRAVSPYKLSMLGDDTGDNISAKNPRFCEMTAIYWAWKNDKASSYIGSLHYRRFFDFRTEQHRKLDLTGTVLADGFDGKFIEEYGLSDDNVTRLVRSYDVVIPEGFDVANVGCASVRQHYETAPYHHIEDLELAGRIISRSQPQFSPYFEKMMVGRTIYPNNMFIMKRDIFEAYCNWIFQILDELDKSIDTSSYNIQENRAVGYIAERLFTVFTMHLLEQRRLKILQLRRVFVLETSAPPAPPSLPDTTRRLVSVVASCDQAYLPHMASLIASVFCNADATRHVDFIVLDGGLTSEHRKSLVELEALHPSATVSFLDMSKSFLSLRTHTYFTRGTFFRLAMPSLLSNRSKVLFLDTDMVVLGDVAELLDTPMDGKMVAAVPDLVMRSFVAMKVPSLLEAGGLPADEYLAEVLNMGTEIDAYFQAGTMVFDLEAFRASHLEDEIIEDLKSNIFWFLDQDALNKHLLGNVKFLSNRWNSLNFDQEHQQALSSDDKRSYLESQEAALIVHFAGRSKPWLNDDHPLSRHYWRYLRLTSWYEPTLARYVRGAGGVTAPLPGLEQRGVFWRTARKGWSLLPRFAKARLWHLATWLRKTL